jgi:TonB family protein
MPSSSESTEGFVRTERREREHVRLLHRTLLFAVAIHVAAAVAINPSFLLRLLRPNVPVGLAGDPQRGELAPRGPEGKDRFSFLKVRRYTGPVTLTHYELVGTRPAAGTPSPADGRPVAGNAGKSGPMERNVRGRSGGSGGELVIELGEDFAVVQRSGPIAQSEKFQALKIVRPEYPLSAIRRGIEGLVRLRVEVDAEGSVVEVDAIENTAQDSTLEQAAVEAMGLWKFRPYRLESRAVPFTLIVPFRYRLID